EGRPAVSQRHRDDAGGAHDEAPRDRGGAARPAALRARRSGGPLRAGDARHGCGARRRARTRRARDRAAARSTAVTMPASRPFRLEPERDGRFGRMIGLSTLAHAAIVVLLVVAGERSGYRPPPMVAYTVEITDPNALGGRLPPGAKGPNLLGGSTRPP